MENNVEEERKIDDCKGKKKNKKKKRGFTLIELLAVIVILGLLLAIAIPSITRYITQSRRKTVTSSIDSYISSAINAVNDQDYKFTEPNKIYAVPIECISLEKGGKNPFGEWLHANPDYWAYVLVQYDSEEFSYNYGFTFKDSAGYGMYPTSQDKINPKSSDQIKTGLELTKPESGPYTNIAAEKNWTGFELNETTQVVVLNAEPEGIPGNGATTCTLCQKGKNYNSVEKEEEKEELPKEMDYTLMATTTSNTTAFWGYKNQIKTITFQDSINMPNDITDEYKWDVSATGKGKVMAYISPNSSDSSYYDLYIQGDGSLYANPDSSYLFYQFNNVDSINNIEILNTSKVSNMRGMFSYTGSKSTIFTLDLGDKFNTSNVSDMQSMFSYTGMANTFFTLDLGDNFDTTNVTSMAWMFNNTGKNSTVFTLDLGDNFNTSNVTNMRDMFYNIGWKNPTFTLDLGDNFDTSKVTNMEDMFYHAGNSSTVFTLDLGEKFNTGNVINMEGMFCNTGWKSTVFTLELGDQFNTSNVTNMKDMFQYAGDASPVFTLNLGDNFDTSKVTTMESMFYHTGTKSTVFTLDLGDKFNTSNVTDMSSMFEYTGSTSTEFTLDLGDKFNTSNVTDMYCMFYKTGYSSSAFQLDCSNWDVSKVTSHTSFNSGVDKKVIAPNWVN